MQSSEGNAINCLICGNK